MRRETLIRLGLSVLLLIGWGILWVCSSRIGQRPSGEVILVMAAISVWTTPKPQTRRQKIRLSFAYCFAFVCYAALYLAGKYGI